ncbi:MULTISPECIES: hypothetical protein [unclassified Streptomyces]|uniref:hypothetical protein n=1 Tax=unclassified Streptomyces TaxID=2593676 RepID=UPI002DDAC15A|nr:MULTISPECIES: hypothetical protein [unclassified Streptomyces]WSA94578.1 hypothetical protein OIE63_25650 [Streptomyces sp. NBC_01795]WSB78998.1 hypothetical protein OHB04_26770 [Streptomyces sp. NBC_01775]WSS12801.1 hypothetical protein OG533_13460 [Streptomyces sp. NBC_01186]WSS41585.1 hypothetical protein OG220_13990 [Streptomyces sp. NBC_01187]
MGAAQEFTFERRGDRSVVISHYGSQATVLRGASAERFLTEVTSAGGASAAQLVMARWTGNYRRGNERTAQQHQRNRHR